MHNFDPTMLAMEAPTYSHEEQNKEKGQLLDTGITTMLTLAIQIAQESRRISPRIRACMRNKHKLET
jgi:hypothetical protein